MSNPIADAHDLAARLIGQARLELGEQFDELRQRELRELESAALDLASLVAEGVQGGRVEAELAHVKARIANWTWVGADRVRARWKAWLERAAEDAGRVLKAVAKGLIS